MQQCLKAGEFEERRVCNGRYVQALNVAHLLTHSKLEFKTLYTHIQYVLGPVRGFGLCGSLCRGRAHAHAGQGSARKGLLGQEGLAEGLVAQHRDTCVCL